MAGEIYVYAADKITAYCQNKYGESTEDTIQNQLEDYIIIADQVSSYLLGNAVALVSPETDVHEIEELVKHIRKVAEYERLQNEKNKESLIN